MALPKIKNRIAESLLNKKKQAAESGSENPIDPASIFNVDLIADENRKAFASMGHVNLILTGRSGAGKSTLVNAMFRKALAPTDIGLPVTQETTCYTASDLPLRVYDTKGIELGADAQCQVLSDIHDLIQAGAQAEDSDKSIDVIWYCVNSGTNRIEPKELEWIKELSSYNKVGLVVVLTQCFRKEPSDKLKEVVEAELGKQAACVKVLAQSDPYDRKKTAFGLDTLMNVTMDLMPEKKKKLALINAQGISINLKETAARELVKVYSQRGLILSANDATLIFNEISMCVRLTYTFGIDLDKFLIFEAVSTLFGVVAATIGGRAASGAIAKHIPGIGFVPHIANISTAGAVTYALGQTYVSILVMLAKGEVKAEDIKTDKFKAKIRGIFKKEYQDAKSEAKENAIAVRDSAKDSVGKFFKFGKKKAEPEEPAAEETPTAVETDAETAEQEQ